MKDNKSPGTVFYVNIALVVALIIILIAALRPFFIGLKNNKSGQFVTKNNVVVPENTTESVYDINKVKAGAGIDLNSQREYSDFKDMYENAPPNTVGGNMVKSWSRVKPADKARLMEGFDSQIAGAEEKLKQDPADKHANNILQISKILKDMSRNGFNYKFKEKK